MSLSTLEKADVNPQTRRQIADQKLSHGNLALAENHLNGIPIRVHRGKAQASNIPEGFRYRYDGLYRVASYWPETGRDGFKIWPFRIEKAAITDDLADGTRVETTNKIASAGNEKPQ